MSLRLIVIGIMGMAIGLVIIIRGKYTSSAHGVSEIITPQSNPAGFWEPCLLCLVVGFAFFAIGIYMAGRK